MESTLGRTRFRDPSTYLGKLPWSKFIIQLSRLNKLLFAASEIAKDNNKMETVGWQSDPNGRGTFTLVSSCVFTLTICVYSAMHLNVPPRGESSAKFWLRNIRWALLGIFGPELVVFIAWKQYLSAKAIAIRSQNRIEGETCPSREGGVPQRVGIVRHTL